MSTARTAAGALFTTVSDSAQAVSATVNTAASFIHMANDFANAQRIKQQAAIKVDLYDHEVALAQRKSMEIAQRNLEIGKFLTENPDAKEAYETSLAELKALLNPTK